MEEHPSLLLEETYHGIRSQRKSRRQGPGKRLSSRISRFNLSEANVGKLRSSISTGQLGTLSGFTRRHDESIATELLPPASLQVPYFPATSLPSARGSPSVSSTGRRQDAMEIFEQYGISRPGGWLSEDGSVILEKSERPPTKVFRVCHSCGEPLASRKYCPHCGHDSCVKCTSEIPDDELERAHESIRQHEHNTFQHSITQTLHRVENSNQDHLHSTHITVRTVRRQASSSDTAIETPKPVPQAERTPSERLEPPDEEEAAIYPMPLAPQTAISTSVRNNPFFIADREAKVGATEPKTTAMNVRANRPTRLSDCIPHKESHPPSSCGSKSEGRCSNPNCRATHAGNHPFRHSIACAARQNTTQLVPESANLEEADTDESRTQQTKHSPLQGTLERKIDQLYHHAEDLHHSQHIMEHLAAGSRTLERTAAQQRWADTHGETGLATRRQSPRDHSLARDSIARIGYDMPVHSLRRDVKLPDPAIAETHPLSNDLVTDRELSPKSHELPKDVRTKVAEWVKPHSIYQDAGSETQKGDIKPLSPSFPVLKPMSPRTLLDQPKTRSQQRVGPVENTHASRQSQSALARQPSSQEGQKVLPPALNARKSVTDKQKAPDEVPGLALERPTLRKVQNTLADRDRGNTGASNVSSWRQQLRKVDKSEERPRDKQPTPPVVKWRRSLSKLPPTPHAELDKAGTCTFCHLSEASSSKPVEGTPRLVVDEIARTPEYEQSYSAKPQNSRLRLKQVELSLARKSAEDLAEESRNQAEEVVIETREVRTIKHCKTMSHSSLEETESITEIHNPRPVIPPNHVCAWRTRYMDLSTEVDQLKSEASSRPLLDPGSGGRDAVRSDVAVGGNLNQHQCPEIRIEGLTIVMHMRGKDDLVINTNLKNDDFSSDGGK